MAETVQSMEGLASLKTASPEAPKYEKKVDAQGRAYATGKRKNAVARVWIKPGKGQITINGSPIDELSYLNLPGGDTAASDVDFDVTVPANSLWVMGDNRDRSQDSRAHQDLPGGGFVPLGDVVGRAFLTTWPLDRFSLIDTHDEVFRSIPEPKK